ncbi:MAG: Uma2 family endonuclease [Gemmataceae bacterium]
MASAILNAPSPSAAPVSRPLKLFTVAEYQQMVRHGIVKATDRCHLIRGLIVRRPPINPPHATVMSKLYEMLIPLVVGVGCVRPQTPVALADSQPQPDVTVAVGRQDDYATVHPGPKDVLLVIEVADSSLLADKTEMFQLYAENKLPVYWLVNIPNRQVEVYTLPRGGKSPTYRGRAVYGPGQAIPVVLAGQAVGSIPVSELLP